MSYDSKNRVAVVVNAILLDKTHNKSYSVIPMTDTMAFYYNRLRSLYMYSLVQGRELIKMICRCAFNDSTLTDTEAIVIMETCLDPALDNLLLEVNYNESW